MQSAEYPAGWCGENHVLIHHSELIFRLKELVEQMVVTNSAAETRAFGEQLAEKLKAGDVVLLEGELGAGKSELARGVAKGLGVQETVTSPSFTILNVYESG